MLPAELESISAVKTWDFPEYQIWVFNVNWEREMNEFVLTWGVGEEGDPFLGQARLSHF